MIKNVGNTSPTVGNTCPVLECVNGYSRYATQYPVSSKKLKTEVPYKGSSRSWWKICIVRNLGVDFTPSPNQDETSVWKEPLSEKHDL